HLAVAAERLEDRTGGGHAAIDQCADAVGEAGVAGHHGLRLQDVLGLAARFGAARLQVGGDGLQRVRGACLLGRRAAVVAGVRGRLRNVTVQQVRGAGADSGADACAVKLAHLASSVLSPAAMAASVSSSSSAPSPSALITMVSPCRTSRPSTARMLFALTGCPPPLATVTSIGDLAAVCTNVAAGRACSPTSDLTVTVRSGTWSSLRIGRG